ncbi:MAG: molybdopterin cofactor-binding domain-containing protein [Holophaga sp.]
MRRRGFLRATGVTGLVFFFRGSLLAALQGPPLTAPRLPDYPGDFNAYLRIGADGRVGCFTGKVELGQGIMTSLALVLAEELDVAPDQVDMLMGDTDLCPWDRGTGGSTTLWQFGPVLRGAAAEARAVLVQMAGERLGVPAGYLEVKDGVVSVKGYPSRQVSYAQLAQGSRIERHLGDVKPKPLAAHSVAGRSLPRLDGPAKVTGAARFTGDLALPGTLHACVIRPRAHGLAVKAVDTSAAEKIRGVRVVRDGDLVAVLHEQPDQARMAAARVRAVSAGAEPAVDDRSIYRHLETRSPALKVANQRGDLAAGEAKAAVLAEAEYRNAYVAHAAIEPHTAVARWEDGRMTVWAGTQSPFHVRTEVAKALDLPEDKVRIIVPFVGGGFGGKSAGPQAVEAARLARVAGSPVQVAWDRREEFFLDTFRPAAVVKVRAGLDPDGRICFWDYRDYGIDDHEAELGYDFAAKRILATGESGGTPGLHPFPTGAWRAPGANTNTFARESHLDVLAAKAKADPLEFRLRHLTDQRLVRVLKAAAERFGWTPAPAPSGRGVGLACGAWRGTLVAAMAEVAVDRETGQVRVKRVTEALDMGPVVNPDGARQQIEGAVTMGLGYALAEEVAFKGGRILVENFDRYPIPLFSWVPEIDVVLVDNPDIPCQGCGEPPIVCMGAVLANAIFDAVGARVTQLPMTPERVLASMP